MTDAQIIKTYGEEETAAGGHLRADPLYIIDAVVSRLGVDRKRVRDVMVAHWTGQGAG
jgi:hypothetical protein